MLTVRVYDDYNLIALQGLDTDDFGGCEFSMESRAKTIEDMEKLMAFEDDTLNLPPSTDSSVLSRS